MIFISTSLAIVSGDIGSLGVLTPVISGIQVLAKKIEYFGKLL